MRPFPGVDVMFCNQRLIDPVSRQSPTDSFCLLLYITPQGNAVPGNVACFNNPGEENHMNAAKITGIILIVIGLAGFFTGGFSFTKDTTAAKIGPIELKVQEKESVNIPQWLSLGALALGVVVLAAGFRKS
jgi:hypothetical protein